MSRATPLRVMFPMVGTQIGGATVSTAEMLRRLLVEGRVEPLVVVPREGPSNALFRAAGVEPVLHDAAMVRATTLRANTTRWSGRLRAIPTYLAMHRQALTLLRRHRPDVLHLNEDRLVLPWGTAARRARVPVVWHVRQERPNPLLDGLRLRLVHHLVFVADANRVRFAASRRLPPATTLHNVVDLRRFWPAADAAAAKAAVGLDPDRPTLAFLGNLFARKRPDWVLRAAATLQPTHRLQVLVIGAPLGEARYVQELHRLATRLPEPAHVHLLGNRNDVPDLLRASDLLTLPSVVRGEAFPRAIIEAMACGVPVVATDVAGAREAVDHERTGLLVDPDDFDGYVAALDRLLANPTTRARMGAAAAARAIERFGGTTLAASLAELYEGLGPGAVR